MTGDGSGEASIGGSAPFERLRKPPIVEAVLDIDCDMPPAWGPMDSRAELEAALSDTYPKVGTGMIQEHEVEFGPLRPPTVSARSGVGALVFFQEDGKQVVQVRVQGFSFNRLTPYASLDDYLPEIERTWMLFVKLVGPVQVLRVQLRYINRIGIPVNNGEVELERYLVGAPQFPNDPSVGLTGFLIQLAGVEDETGNEVTAVLTAQPPREGSSLPVIFDIATGRAEKFAPPDWDHLYGTIQSLRTLKNRVFHNALTSECLDLFR